MVKRRKASGVGEASVPPTPSTSERETLEASVASLSGLDVDQLRLQWRNHLGGVAPSHLPRWLLMRVLAYRIQAAAFGDLDRAILRRLRESGDEAFKLGGARPFATRGPTTREGVGLAVERAGRGSGQPTRCRAADCGCVPGLIVARALSATGEAITLVGLAEAAGGG